MAGLPGSKVIVFRGATVVGERAKFGIYIGKVAVAFGNVCRVDADNIPRDDAIDFVFLIQIERIFSFAVRVAKQDAIVEQSAWDVEAPVGRSNGASLLHFLGCQ